MDKINETQSGRGYLFRVSASDVCNYDCNFCHPSSNESVTCLTDEELIRIFRVMNDTFKLKTLHFTGGEPLMRRGLTNIIRSCRAYAGDELDIAITTNAALLDNKVDELLDAGLSRANVSIHSLNREKYMQFTNSQIEVGSILETVKRANEAGIKIKVNSVVIRNFNDMDITKMADFCFENNIIPRFLELGLYGPVVQWFSKEDQVPHKEILERLQAEYGPFERDLTYRGNGPSKYYRNAQGFVFGILDNQSDVMCRGCDRFRMSANGYIKVCNFKPINLREYMGSDEELKEQLLVLGDVLNSRGENYIGNRRHYNDYNFRWNHPEKNM